VAVESAIEPYPDNGNRQRDKEIGEWLAGHFRWMPISTMEQGGPYAMKKARLMGLTTFGTSKVQAGPGGGIEISRCRSTI